MKRKVSAGKSGSKMNSNNQILCVIVVILIGIGLIILARRNNLLGLGNNTEGFNSQPMELNRLNGSPNPDSNTIIVILFYVDWCPHCRTVKPAWGRLVNRLNNTQVNGKNVVVQACNAEGTEIEKQVANTQNIQGYPTIKAIKNNGAAEHNGPRTEEGIEAFINSQCS